MNTLTWRVCGRTADYTVTLSTDGMVCTCPARVEECRHIRAVRMLQKLALLDKEAVNTLEELAKAQQEGDPFQRTGYQPEPGDSKYLEPGPDRKPMSAKEKLDAVFGYDEIGVTHEY